MLRTSLKHYADRNGLCVSELNHLEVANPDVCGYSKAVGCSCFFYQRGLKSASRTDKRFGQCQWEWPLWLGFDPLISFIRGT